MAGPAHTLVLHFMLFEDDCGNRIYGPMCALSNGATYPKLRQARADLKASNTSTGITESSRGEIGPDPERVVAERSPGINTLAGTIA